MVGLTSWGWLGVGVASVGMGFLLSALKVIEAGPANFADGEHLPLWW